MSKSSKGYEDEHYYNMTKEEAQMSKMEYDPKDGTFKESEGWRSWGCVTFLAEWVLGLLIIVWLGFLGLILAIPYIIFAVLVGVGIAALLGYI